MNLLGHLYLSQNESPEVRLFNLLGDRYKGSRFDALSHGAQKGIRIHREIDHFMDNHNAVMILRTELSGHLPKVSGVALDIFFDFILASAWTNFHKNSLDEFLDSFFESIINEVETIPQNYASWIKNLQEHKYIHRYNHIESVVAISEHLHHKLNFKTEIDKAPIIFYTFESRIREVFEEYITDARKNFGIS